MLDEVVDLRNLILFVEEHFVEINHVFLGNELVSLCGWRLLRERFKEFMLPSQEKQSGFIEKGHILHMRKIQAEAVSLFRLIFQIYIQSEALPTFVATCTIGLQIQARALSKISYLSGIE
jgi:hypothetical protein